jgi:hypothetical protein
MTRIAPRKKTVRRIIAVRMAFGMTFSGFFDSPAATPMSSVPEKA